MKSFILNATSTVVIAALISFFMVSNASPAYAGVTNLSGISVAEEGLAVTDAGPVDLGTGTVQVSSSTFIVNGLRMHAVGSASLNAASTTAISLQGPTTASSTIVSVNCGISVSSTTASTWTIAKAASTVSSGSTTPLQSFSVSAGAQAALVLPATTTTAGVANMTLGPGERVNVTVAGSAGTFTPTGKCSLLAVILN